MTITDDDAKQALNSRIEAARKDRSRHATILNRYYTLALPSRVRISDTAPQPDNYKSMDAYSDVFDSTLQDAVSDFVADMMDAFTPHYRPWARLKPRGNLPTGMSKNDMKKLEGELERAEEDLYGTIRNESDFYEQSQEVWAEAAGSAGGISIPWAPIGEPIRCTPITMGNLLFDQGAQLDLDGRWQEFWCKKGELNDVFRDADIQDAIKANLVIEPKGANTPVRVVQGAHRQPGGKKSFIYSVLIENEYIWKKVMDGEGACPVHVLRWRTSPPSAWGPGPGVAALPPASALDEIAYDVLKFLGKQTDPPFSYLEDGLFNPEGGIDAGRGYPHGPNWDMKWLVPDNDLQATLIETERLENMVKRALYQSGPEQEGKTPPTATQWLDERAKLDRRLQLSRMRIYREWVLSVLNRFWYIQQRRGMAPKVELGGKQIEVEFDSPVTKASDMEEVSRALQTASAVNQTFGEAAMLQWDSSGIMEKIIEKLDDSILTVKPIDQQELVGRLSEMRNLVSDGKP